MEGECAVAEYQLRDKGGVTVKNTEYLSDGTFNVIDGKAYASTLRPGRLNVIFFAEFGANYRVVSTDYTDYAVVYSCTTILGNSLSIFIYAWVLVRD